MKHERHLCKFVDLFSKIDDSLPAFHAYWRMYSEHTIGQTNSPTPRHCLLHELIPEVCAEIVQFCQDFCRIFGASPEGQFLKTDVQLT
jgi:hypothetical protein